MGRHAAIEIAGGFGIPLDVDKSFESLVSGAARGPVGGARNDHREPRAR
ncbi:hypothetical protein [Candidatus Binatus sp.]